MQPFPIKLKAMSHRWYALHVKPHKEQSVYELLKARETEVYYPVLKVEPVNPRARKERPFFPGYMFVFLDLDQEGANALRWTEGTHGLVQFGDEPAIVPKNLIHELRDRLANIEASGGLKREELKKGDVVQIVDGVLEGYRAIFDTNLPGKDRVQVLLTYLSQQPKRLQIDRVKISKVKD